MRYIVMNMNKITKDKKIEILTMRVNGYNVYIIYSIAFMEIYLHVYTKMYVYG